MILPSIPSEADRERRADACPRLRALLVVADHHLSVGHEPVRGNLQIVRSRLVLEDAPGHVEGRTVTRTHESPFVAQLRILPRRERTAGRTTQMRADADRDEVVGLDRAE